MNLQYVVEHYHALPLAIDLLSAPETEALDAMVDSLIVCCLSLAAFLMAVSEGSILRQRFHRSLGEPESDR